MDGFCECSCYMTTRPAVIGRVAGGTIRMGNKKTGCLLEPFEGLLERMQRSW
jgi:hypothetical protein